MAICGALQQIGVPSRSFAKIDPGNNPQVNFLAEQNSN